MKSENGLLVWCLAAIVSISVWLFYMRASVYWRERSLRVGQVWCSPRSSNPFEQKRNCSKIIVIKEGWVQCSLLPELSIVLDIRTIDFAEVFSELEDK